MTKRIQFSDLCVVFWELNKTTEGGGLLPESCLGKERRCIYGSR